ncbi:DUF192 domain-containing protein [Roseiconus nitratireducens]|uniref:DUF192 domain-containing protein n=1 Tax=Roseiconus nitratireducens TaxID=2605748 RepID=A0A5M6DEC9_9BACT|nr:DUF192 domain-containing protein [Roseiconus nitratireducens]KAA5545878.1 DUF192 domain-containing protein [Roseiconus nitratireducens]
MQLIDSQTQEILLPSVEVASTIWQRFRGLMFRRKFCEGYGLWLQPCRSIHTMWMRVPIDVYFIDQDGRIVEHRLRVTPWSIVVPCQDSRSVLEVPSGTKSLVIGTSVYLKDRNR